MKKHSRRIILTVFMLICLISIFGCGKEQITDKEEVQSEITTDEPEQNEADNAPEQDDEQDAHDAEYLNGYANPQGNRITYADGYYYYASQLDNYFLYRVKEDGSDAKCLAKVHSGSILADGDVLYFVNLSDDKAIYKIGTDGSDMQKICDNYYNRIQMSVEYIYFCGVFEREADIRGLFSEEEAEEIEAKAFPDRVFYRIRKDGSGKEILAKSAWACVLAAESGEKTAYDGYFYWRRSQWNEETEQSERIIMRCDLNAENEEEICRFEFDGDNLIVCGDRIYCFSTWGENVGKIGEYIIGENEVKYLPEKELTDCCVYNGALYGIAEDVDEDSRSTRIYKLNEGETQWEEIYHNDAECLFFDGNVWETSLTDIYATEQGVFFRQFVSPEEGVKWFSLGEEDNAGKWEDENVIPIVKQASMLEYNNPESYSIKPTVNSKSTSGYEAYLKDDLTYEEFYWVDEEGEGHYPYTIRLPQFNEIIEGYQEINAYFQSVYKEALAEKEEFFDMLDEKRSESSYESMDYDYVYIGEKYITVAKYRSGYWYGTRGAGWQQPVTFERKTGRVVTLEDFFGEEPGEAVARVTASIYKYMENGERDYYNHRKYFLKDEDILTEEFIPEQFFLFPEGIGIYYRAYAIGSGAEGDFVFIVPYPERNEAGQQEAEEDESGYANPQGNRITYEDGYY